MQSFPLTRHTVSKTDVGGEGELVRDLDKPNLFICLQEGEEKKPSEVREVHPRKESLQFLKKKRKGEVGPWGQIHRTYCIKGTVGGAKVTTTNVFTVFQIFRCYNGGERDIAELLETGDIFQEKGSGKEHTVKAVLY